MNQHVSYWVALPLCVGIGAADRRARRAGRRAAPLERARGPARSWPPSAWRRSCCSGRRSSRSRRRSCRTRRRSPRRWEIGGVFVRGEHLVILVVMPALCLFLAWFLARTRAGLQIRAAAANPAPGGSPASTCGGPRRRYGARRRVHRARHDPRRAVHDVDVVTGDHARVRACWCGCSRRP